jgi:hypothetical protein
MLYKIKDKALRNLSNIPGWRTNRKIVVIESDDWGSIRMASNEALEALHDFGLPVKKSHYNRFDALESNDDMKALFETLQKFKDKNNKTPVITAVAIVGNPDFKKIKENHFQNYEFEPFTNTLQKYPNHDEVFKYYKLGIGNRWFVPIFHGREHLNVQRWMQQLQNGNESVLKAFEWGVTGISKDKNKIELPDFQAAFDIDQPSDLSYLSQVLNEGLNLFKDLFGYPSEYFVPTNGPFNNTLETVLNQNGVKFINTGKKQIEPLGNNQFKTNLRFIGKKNNLGQLYITRNCFFEPSSFEHDANKNWVEDCLKEIEIAFRWKKPAVISTHRVNYIGSLDPDNRTNGLAKLESLLTKMLKKWPDIEFMTSVELGREINK